MSMTIGIAAGKDGSGKTFFAGNLGAMLAEGGASVALVDLNYGMRGLDLLFGLESNVVYDLGDVFKGEATLRQAEVKDDRFRALSLFSCPQDLRTERPGEEDIKRLYGSLKKFYDFVIVDLPGGPWESLPPFLSGLDKAVLVITPEQDALRNAETVNELLRARGVQERTLLLNRVKREYFEVNRSLPEDVVERFRIPLLGILLHDENIYFSGFTGVPPVMEDSGLTDTFRRICLSLVETEK